MHKKRIHDKWYYYTSYRGEDGKVKSKYLGDDEKLALKKEREFKGEGRNDLWVYALIILFVGGAFFGGLFGSDLASITGYAVYDPVSFAWNESWDVNFSFVRVSLNEEVYDVPVNVVDNSVFVDLNSFSFNSSGTGYIDLVVNEQVVDSESFDILHESVDALNTSSNETVSQTVDEVVLLNESVLNITNESVVEIVPVNDTVLTNETVEVVEPVNESVEVLLPENETVEDIVEEVVEETDPNVVQFALDESWDLANGFVRMSQDGNVVDVDLVELVFESFIIVNLSNYEFVQGAVYVDLIYAETIVDSESVQFVPLVVLDEPLVNLTLNQTVEDFVNISNETLVDLNVTNVTLGYTVLEENLSQYGAVIGEPVKWKKKLVLEGSAVNVNIKIPWNAEDVIVRERVYGMDVEVGLDDIKVNDSGVIKDIKDTDLVDSDKSLISGMFSGITGMFSASITGMFVAEEGVGDVSLIIEEEVEEVEVEYYTEAPLASEEIVSYGKKVVVSADTHYENILTYTSIPDTALGNVELYWIVNGSRVEHSFDGYDTNGNGLVDYLEWVTPHTSEQEFQIELTILNVQSYPIVGGNWTVMFNTTGNANLTVRAINETTFGDALPDDLRFLELRCGDTILTQNLTSGIVFVENYSCADIGYEVSHVMTSGVHDLEFTFGNITAFAHNDATNPPTHTTPILNSSDGSNNTNADLIVYNQSTGDLDGDPVKNIYNWYKDGTSLAVLNMPFEGGSNATHTKDYTSHSNNGSVTDATWNRTGGYDGFGAYSFDGNDKINISNSVSLSFENSMSLSLWFNSGSAGGVQRIVSKGNMKGIPGSDPTGSYTIAINGDTDTLYYSLDLVNEGKQEAVSVGDFTDGEWNHVVGVFNGTDILLYVNGEKVANFTSGIDSLDNSNSNLLIGVNGDSDQYFVGMIDDILFFNHSLNVNQISALYQNKTNFIHSDETDVGDVWNVSATPNDGYVDGETLWSNALTVVSNNAPTHTTPILNSSDGSNNTNANLTVYNKSTADVDGDPVKNIYNWYKDGTSLAVLNMPFEGGNTTLDYSGYGNNGTVTSATWNRTSGYDGAGTYEFDGLDDYVELPDSSLFSPMDGDYSIFAWIKPLTLVGSEYKTVVLGYGSTGSNHMALSVNSSNYVSGFVRDGAGDNLRVFSNSALSINTWHLVGWTWNVGNKNLTVFVDGVVENSGVEVTVDSLDMSGFNTWIGANGRYGSDYFNGTIDDVMIFNHSLSANQVLALYQNKTNFIHSDETDVGDVWNATITPNDGYVDGTTLWSNALTILETPNSAPTHSTPILNSTLGTNLSTENLTVFNQSTADVDGDNVKNIYNWYKDGESITLLNMPFDINGSNENQSLVRDYSGFGNNGSRVWNATNGGATWSMTGGYDGFGAYSFDGIDDYIDLGGFNLNGSTSATFTCWMKIPDISGLKQIIDNRQFYIHTNGERLVIDIHSGGSWGGSYFATPESTFSANKWHHIAIVYENGIGTTTYIDSVKAQTTQDNDNGALSQGSIGIGKIGIHSDGTTSPFNGTIDDVVIYNMSLSPSQILALYENKTNFIHSDETNYGEVWNATITPNDGYVDGETLWSNALTITDPYPDCTGDTATGNWVVSGTETITTNQTCNTVTVSGTLNMNSLTNNASIWINANNITVTGTINGNGYGYAAGVGPGVGSGSGDGGYGAGHGGWGGNGSSNSKGGDPYGDSFAPAFMGSGGESEGCGAAGGAGGGAFKLNVTDTFYHNGTVRVNGNAGGTGNCGGVKYAAGSGSGGSIWVVTDTLKGTGVFQAIGGAGSNRENVIAGGGGAGGRVVVYYNTQENFDFTTSSVAGGSAQLTAKPGEQGTLAFIDMDSNEIFIKDGFEFSGDLNYVNITVWDHSSVRLSGSAAMNATYFENLGYSNFTCKASSYSLNISSLTNINFSNTNIKNEVINKDCNNINISLGSKNVSFVNSFVEAGSDIFVDASELYLNSSYFNAGSDLSLERGLTTDNNYYYMRVYSGDNLTLSLSSGSIGFNASTISSSGTRDWVNFPNIGVLNLVNTSVGGNFMMSGSNLSIDSDSSISASSRGYPGGYGSGQGTCYSVYHSVYCGGSGHGWFGGDSEDSTYYGGSPYGDAFAPSDYGSGGKNQSINVGGTGGGRVRIILTDTLNLTGVVYADGGQGNQREQSGDYFTTGGGAGGSIWVTTNDLVGSGHFEADGGAGRSYGGRDSGGGSGGRIVVYYNTSDFDFVTSHVNGGVKAGAAEAGHVGSLAFIDNDDSEIFIKDGFDFTLSQHNFTNVTIWNYSNVRFNTTTVINTTDFWNLGYSNFSCRLTSDDFKLISVNKINLSNSYFRGVDRSNDCVDLNFSVGDRSVVYYDSMKIEATNDINFNVSDSLTLNDSYLYTSGAYDNVWVYASNYLTLLDGSYIAGNFNFSSENLTLSADSYITATGRGYTGSGGPNDGGAWSAYYGMYTGGGGHGWHGGATEDANYKGGSPYGDPFAPSDYGAHGTNKSSRVGATGGGKIRVVLADTLNITGIIYADGNQGNYWDEYYDFTTGGGAGGSIWVNTDDLVGSGHFEADGGAGRSFGGLDSGAGAGGRIALYYNTSSSDLSISHASGGVKAGAAQAGSTGSYVAVDVDDSLFVAYGGFDFQQNVSYTNVTFVNASIRTNISIVNISASDWFTIENSTFSNSSWKAVFDTRVYNVTNFSTSLNSHNIYYECVRYETDTVYSPTPTYNVADVDNDSVGDVCDVIVELVAPANASFDYDSNVTFVCNATSDTYELVNMTLYHNATGFGSNQTNAFTGNVNETNFTINNLNDNEYIWNCMAANTLYTSFAVANWSFTVNTAGSTLNVTLDSPEDSLLTINATQIFNCSVEDLNSLSSIANLTLYGDWGSGWEAKETVSLVGDSNQTSFMNTIPADGTYNWNCLAGNIQGATFFAYANRTIILDRSVWNTTYLINETDTLVYNYSGGDVTQMTYNLSTKAIHSVVNETAQEISSEWVDTDGLVLLLHMNEGSGTLVDSSGYGNDGTSYNGTTYGADGRMNGALQFDGADDYVSVGDATGFDNQGEITYMAWISPTGDGDVGIFSKRPAFLLYSTKNELINYINSTTWKNTGYAPYPLQQGEWVHVAGVYNNTNDVFKLYINGEVAAENGENYGAIGNDPGNLMIGWDDGVSGRYFKGMIDEVAIWNRSLTDFDVKRIYERQKTTNVNYDTYESEIFNASFVGTWNNISWLGTAPYGLDLPDNAVTETAPGGANMAGNVVLLHMDEQINGSTVVDSSGQSNNGTVNGDIKFNQSGIFNTSLGFDGYGDYLSIADDFGIGNTVTLEAWMKPSTKDGHMPGTLQDLAADTWEFDIENSYSQKVVHVAEDVYLVAYGHSTTNTNSDIITVRIDDGSIQEVIDKLQYDAGYVEDVALIDLGANIFALAYKGEGYDGYLKTFNVSDDGNIVGLIETLEYEASLDGIQNDLIKVTDDLVAVVYEDNAADGQLKVINVTMGDIIGVTDSWEFDTADGRSPDIINVTGNLFSIVYDGTGNDGWMKTFNIYPNGTIGNELDSFEFDGTNGQFPEQIMLSDEIVAVVYDAQDADDGWIKTINISSDGTIVGAIDSHEYDTNTGLYPSIVHTTGNYYVIAYTGSGSDGYIRTVEMLSNGTIVGNLDYYEFDEAYGLEPWVIFSDGFAKVVYQNTDTDGYLKTFEILDNGMIGSAIKDATEFLTSDVYGSQVSHVIDNVSVVHYHPTGSGTNYIKSYYIYENGTIDYITSTSYSCDTGNGGNSEMLKVAEGVIAVMFRWTDGDGYIKTWNVSNNGSFTAVDIHEFDTADLVDTENDFIYVGNNTYAIAYEGTSSDGFVRTVNILSNGTITGNLDVLEFDTTYAKHISIAGGYDNNTYAVAYCDTNIDTKMVSFQIELNGTISEILDSSIIDANGCDYPATINITNNLSLTSYTLSSGYNGYITTRYIYPNGTIGGTITSVYPDNNRHNMDSWVHVYDDVYLDVFENDGNGQADRGRVYRVSPTGRITLIDYLDYTENLYNSWKWQDPVRHIQGNIFAHATKDYDNDGWLKTIEVVKERGIIKPDVYGIDTTAGKAYGMINGAVLSAPVEYGNWNHLVITYDGATAKFYVNGVLEKSEVIGEDLVSNSKDLLVGKFFNGDIDEFALYSRELSASEVANRYKRGVMELNFSVRSCNDPVCSGESWTGNYVATPQDVSVSDNRYFQYKTQLDSSSRDYPAELRNVSVYYQEFFNVVPNITNVWYTDGNDNELWEGEDITVWVNVTDTDGFQTMNCSLVGNLTGSNTTSTPGNLSIPIFIGNLSSGTYNYNISCTDGLDSDLNVTSFVVNSLYINISLALNPSTAAVGANVVTSGHLNYSNGTDVGNALPSIFLDGVLQGGVGAGDGTDGSLNVTTANVIINNYTYLTSNASAGNTSIFVDNATEFTVGDEILIIQMHNGTGVGVAGQYEFVEISSISDNTLTLDAALNKNYGSGTFNVSSSAVTQVVRVPEYTTVDVGAAGSITAPAWNGWSGGVLVLKATGAITVLGAVNVTGKGYMGGMHTPSAGDYQYGHAGGRTAGRSTARETSSSAINLGGGGAGKGADGSGGGGAYGGAGTNGGKYLGSSDYGRGATAFGFANLSQIYFGGGGGSAGSHSATRVGVAGGAGGGILIMFGGSIENIGQIISKGQKGKDGVAGGDANRGAGGGGGAGGAIYLSASEINISSGIVNASGGLGGTKHVGSNGKDGGNGSVGRIRLDYADLYGASDPIHGFNGTVISDASASVLANATGWYTLNITAPVVGGTYDIKANITYDELYAENTQTLTVVQMPVIRSISLNESVAQFNKSFYLYTNVTDDNLVSVNFTLVDPDAISVFSGLGGTNDSLYWNSSVFTLSKPGTYNYTIVAYDIEGYNDTETGQIDFLIVSLNLDPATVEVESNVVVSGHLNYSNGTDVGNAGVNIFLNGTRQGGGGLNWWNSSWGYKVPVNLSETEGQARTNEAITILLNASVDSLTNCSVEVRVVNNDSQEVPCEISSEVNNSVYRWCNVKFPVNISANTNSTYYVYYGADVSAPGYSAITYNAYSDTTNVALSVNGGTASGAICHAGACSNINDGNTGTCSDAYNGAADPDWWSITWASAKTLNKITFRERCFSDGWIHPDTDYYLEYWDGDSWELATNFVGVPPDGYGGGSCNGQEYSATFDTVSTTAVRLRLYQAGSQTFTGLYELRAFEAFELNNTVGSEESGSARTNSTGWYTQNITVPSVGGSYVVFVNTTVSGYYAEATQTLTVKETPVVTLNPANGTFNVSLETINLNCTATDNDGDMRNFTLYHNLNGSWINDGTVVVPSNRGDNYSYVWTKQLSDYIGDQVKDSNFKWNCLVNDQFGLGAWGTNATFGSWNLGGYNDSLFNISGNNLIVESNNSKQELSSEWMDMTNNVLLYHLDEASGAIVDESGQGNNGSESGGVTFNDTGKLNGALKFDQLNDYVVTSGFGTDMSGTVNLSISFWMKNVEFAQGWTNPLSFGNSKFRFETGANSSRINIYNTGICDSTPYCDPCIVVGQWHQIGFRSNDSNWYLYVDGNVVDNGSVMGTMDTGADMYLGFRYPSTQWWNGSLDEIAIWDRTISHDEMVKIYNRQKGDYINTANYTSRVFDAGGDSSWANITWDESVPYGEELPANQAVETVSGGANMTGNVLLYHFNNDSDYGENDQRNVSNSIYDFSGNGNNGTLGNVTVGTNPTWNSVGRLGGGYEFDGINDYIDLGSKIINSSTGTIGVWVKLDTFENADKIVGYGGGDVATPGLLGLETRTNGGDHFGVIQRTDGGSANGCTSETNIILGVWYHVVLSSNGIVWKMYINGQEEGLSCHAGENNGNWFSDTAASSPDKITLGAIMYDGSIVSYTNGTIDEVAIWNRTLSADEISNIYKRGALNINVSAKSCNDAVCDGESFVNFGSVASLTNLSGLDENQYFQYRLFYDSLHADYSPELSLNTVTAAYVSGNTAPNVTAVTLTSTSPSNYSNGTLVASWEIQDAENDSAELNETRWWKNNILQTALANATNITNGNLSKNEVWNFSVKVYDGRAWSNWSDNLTITLVNVPPTVNVNDPTDGELLYRDVSPLLNVSLTDIDLDSLNVTFFNASDNSMICTVTNKTSEATCEWVGLTAGSVYEWFVNVSDGTDVVTSSTWNFTANDAPKVLNMRAEFINTSSVLYGWQNELDMAWVSLRVGSDIMELRSITSVDDSWTVNNIYSNDEFVFEWQIGDDLLAMSDYANFTFRTLSWMPEMANYSYRRLVTINSSLIDADKDGYAVNLSLTEDNFEYYDADNWVYYPSFKRLNWSNGNDIRFVNYYDTTLLDYNVTYWNVPGQGCQSSQTLPNATNFTGNFIDTNKCNDGDWSTQMTPSPDGSYYYNYTIPAGAKTSSMYRIYDGAWGWDLTLPSDCYGGTHLEFKSVANYTIPGVDSYCRNQTDDEWVHFRNNGNVSAYIYETMMTWTYDCQAYISVLPEHFDDASQTYVAGVDGDYDVKFWMYYGNVNDSNNESALSLSGIENSSVYTLGAETELSLGTPEISNINDTRGRSATATNVSWIVDQSVDNRIRYATNPWLLDSTWAAKLINVSETFEHLYGNDAHTVLLDVYSDYYISTVNVSCSNSSYNSNYTLNTGVDPVELTFIDVNDAGYLNWSITYTKNKTYVRNTRAAEFELENLPTNTKYYYEINAYGLGGNGTAIGNFTLGTVPAGPGLEILNYSEDRPNKIVTVCANLSNMNSEPVVNVSIQYWNEGSTTFSNGSVVEKSAVGIFCSNLSVEYNHNYTYRAKGQATTTNYSKAYTNEFMAIQEFFAGSYVEDDNDGRYRQYCTDPPAYTHCYEQRGYWEGSLQQEDWIWIETNISNMGNLTLHWWNGSSWSLSNMTNDSDSDMQYIKMQDLGEAWQTFYITNHTSDLVLNWTKPSPIHLNTHNRTEESKYVAFNGTPELINYSLLYMDYKGYNSSAYQWCMAQPGGNLYDCMSVEYFGGGRESNIGDEFSGTAYDRGRMFRGGIVDGEMHDTGVLNYQRDPNAELGDERFCFAFTVYWWNESIVPSNNISNYYYRYWTKTDWWSSYFGYSQSRRFDFISLFSWQYDLLSYTRDWTSFSAAQMNDENVVLSVVNSTFVSNYNQSLVMGYKSGFEVDTGNDAIYNLGLITDARWTNQQIGKYQQGFVIFNLPDNDTLAGMDSDSDGLNDFEELFTYYTNPQSSDTDEDLRADGVEINLSYDPNLYTEYNTAPNASVVLDRGNYYNNTLINATITYTDYDSDTGAVYVYWYKNELNILNQSFLGLSNGSVVYASLDYENFTKDDTINLSLQAIDWFNVTFDDVTTVDVENSAPTFDFSLTDQTLNSSQLLTYDINCSDVDGDSVSYYDNISLFEINISTGLINVTALQSHKGSHVVNITCSDGEDNSSRTFVYSVTDIQSPTITIIGPDYVTIDTTPTMSFTTNEATTCRYRENDDAFIAMESSDNFLHYKTVEPGLGMHVYDIECNDSSENQNTTNIYFFIASVLPDSYNFSLVTINDSAPFTFNNMSNMNLSVELNDNASSYMLLAEYSSAPVNEFDIDGYTTTLYKVYTINTGDAVEDSVVSSDLVFSYNQTEVVAAGISEADLQVYYYNSDWVEETVTLDATANTLDLTLDHLSEFAIGSATAVTRPTTPAAAAAGGGGGGGGGAGPRLAPEQEDAGNFSLSPTKFEFDLAYEESKEEELIVTNNLNSEQSFTLSTKSIGSVLSLSESKFTLGPKESKNIILNAVSDREPGVHIGSLYVASDYETQVVPVVVEISSQIVLFDATIYVPNDYKEVMPGEEIPAQITLFNMGGPRKVDVLMNYMITDIEGHTIYEESETIAVEGQKSFNRDFFVPANAEYGAYVLATEVIYVNSVATSSTMFNVVSNVERAAAQDYWLMYMILGIIVVITLIGFTIIMVRKK